MKRPSASTSASGMDASDELATSASSPPLTLMKKPSASTSTTDLTAGAFHGVAPSAPTPTPKPIFKRPSYDIFINHRGPDVKSTLATALYDMLTAMTLSVFLDAPELEPGDYLPRTIEAAMTSALLHIAIFSKTYAESPWCLAELAFMLKTGTRIVPIFYYVDPSDLRWAEKGIYAQAFKDHALKARYSPELLEDWKRALHQVSFYSGQIVQNNGDVMELRRKLVEIISKEIKNVPLVVAKHPVGLEEMVEDFERNTLQSVDDQGVQIVGIWGMGGSGKTTLAKELYNKNFSAFGWFSFVSDVREATVKHELHMKQKKILQDCGDQNVKFDDIHEGKGYLSKRLRSAKVLIVVDDVDDVDQLDALVPVKDSLEKGSLIIVTTRECNVLTLWGITSIYKMRVLESPHAKQLFCWHAFIQPSPLHGFEELVEKFLKACHGLPLSLKVIGGQLCKQFSKEYWNSLLHKIKRLMPNDIEKILKISYDYLDSEERAMFLDVACFFIGEEHSLAIDLWDGLGWSGLHGWERLLQKTLVELDKDNRITMHDHIRDLGRTIAKEQSPYRLLPQFNIQAEKQKEDRMAIHGIMASSNRIKWKASTSEGDDTDTSKDDESGVCCRDGKLIVKTTGGDWPLSPSPAGLKYLVIKGGSFNSVMGEVTRDLVWLRWIQMGQRNLLSGLSMKRLRVLELHEEEEYAKSDCRQLEELWESDSEAPVQLRQLLITNCHELRGFPKSIRHLSHLRKIEIRYGYNLRNLPNEFCLLRSLEHLVLQHCKMLLSLPSTFGNLSNLRHLSLQGCIKLRGLPVSFKNLKLMEHLDLRGCSQLKFMPDILQNIKKLVFLDLRWCNKLDELPRHITNQTSLKEFYFSNTSIKELPENIGQLRRLRDMAIVNVLLTSLPPSFGGLSSLTSLRLEDCSDLELLPDSLGDLSSLKNLEFMGCPKLQCLPYSLGRLPSLTHLSIQTCHKLGSLPDSLGGLSSLTDLCIADCAQMEDLPGSLGNLPSLTKLYIKNFPSMKCLPDSLINLFSLKNLKIHCCPELACLPKSLGDLCSLTNLQIKNCLELKMLPDSLGRLSFLTNLCITDCSKLRFLPNSLGELSSLNSLKIRCCFELRHISDTLGDLSSLTKLSIQNCHKLESLPNSIGGLFSLTSLYIDDCAKLDCLPKSLGKLSSLTTFCIRGCLKLKFLPDSIGDLSSLTSLVIKNCLRLKSLSESREGSLGRLFSLTSLYIDDCAELDCLPESLGKLSSLTTLCIRGCLKLKFLPDSIGDLSSLERFELHCCLQLQCLPDSLGDLSSLERFELHCCLQLQCLPDSLGDLSSLTSLSITHYPKLETLPESVMRLNNLRSLSISNCPIKELDFGAVSSPSELSSLNSIDVRETEVSKISFSEDCCPNLERLDIFDNHHLEEIEGLPSTLEIIYMGNCEMLRKMSSFARLTSLRDFRLKGCNRLEIIEGLGNCTGLRKLIFETRLEVPIIESLERLEKLWKLELSANKGPVIERCIQKMEVWPAETKICARTVPEAASLVDFLLSRNSVTGDSLLSPNLVIVDSISNHKIKSSRPKLVQNDSSSGDALLLFFIINCVSSQMKMLTTIHWKTKSSDHIACIGRTKLEKGRWAWVGVFAPYSDYSSARDFYLNNEASEGECGEEDEVEKGLVVRGEEQILWEALGRVLPDLWQS